MRRAISSIALWVAFGMMAPLSSAGSPSLDQDLLLYLPMSADLHDHSPQPQQVKVSGKVELRDHAAYFAGKEDWLELPHVVLNQRTFAIAMWVKVTGQQPMYGLVEQRAAGRSNEWLHVMLRGERQPYLGFYVNDALSPTSIGLDEWTHLVFQYDGGRQQLWINGRLICARTAAAYGGSGGATCLGKSPRWTNVPSRDFEGFMREVRIYGRALSPDEVSQLVRNTAERGPARAAGVTGPLVTPARPPESPPGVPAAAALVPFLSIDGNRLVITGEVGQVYEMQATGDLNATWQPLTTLTNASGRVEFVDTDAPGSGERFYRIKVK